MKGKLAVGFTLGLGYTAFRHVIATFPQALIEKYTEHRVSQPPTKEDEQKVEQGLNLLRMRTDETMRELVIAVYPQTFDHELPTRFVAQIHEYELLEKYSTRRRHYLMTVMAASWIGLRFHQHHHRMAPVEGEARVTKLVNMISDGLITDTPSLEEVARYS